MYEILTWITTTWLSELVLSKAWIFPALETAHFIGLTLLMGALLLIDLRLLGFQRYIPPMATHDLLPFVFIGFGINIVSGVLFFFGDPERYGVNLPFQIKMVMVLLAGLNALWFKYRIDPVMPSWDKESAIPFEAKFVGAASLVLWFSVLFLGRMIPYI